MTMKLTIGECYVVTNKITKQSYTLKLIDEDDDVLIFDFLTKTQDAISSDIVIEVEDKDSYTFKSVASCRANSSDPKLGNLSQKLAKLSLKGSAKRSTKRSAKRSAKRSVKRSAKRSTKRSVKRSAKRSAKRSTKRATKRSAERSAKRYIKRSTK